MGFSYFFTTSSRPAWVGTMEETTMWLFFTSAGGGPPMASGQPGGCSSRLLDVNYHVELQASINHLSGPARAAARAPGCRRPWITEVFASEMRNLSKAQKFLGDAYWFCGAPGSC
jgi:hypothetical protein